ncbi:MAG: glycosyltransferase family 39 protein [Nitrospinota bacterium]|nr:glycosyltransferase family 39 protein [Nitrospinota bacterium]
MTAIPPHDSRATRFRTRIFTPVLRFNDRVDEWIRRNPAARLLGPAGPLRRWREGARRDPRRSGRETGRDGWIDGSLLITAIRRFSAALGGAIAAQAREGIFGRWRDAVARSRTAAPQRTAAAVLLSAMGANAVFLLVSQRPLEAEGLAIRALLLAGAGAATVLKEGGFARWWRAWWPGRRRRNSGRESAATPGTAGPAALEGSPGFLPAMAAGAVAGFFWWLSPGAAFLGLAAAGLAVGLKRFCAPEDWEFLRGLFIASLVLRLALLAVAYAWAITKGWTYSNPNVLDFHFRTPMVFGDGGYFTARAWALSQIWRGAEVWPQALYEIRQVYGATSFLYLPTAFFYLFGPEGLIAVRLINPFIGACLPLMVYGLTRELFGRPAGRIASITVSIFPSLILWSLDLLKDTTFIVITLATVWWMVRFQRRKRLSAWLAAAVMVALSFTVRNDLGILLLALVGLGWIPVVWRRCVGRSPARALLALLLLAAVFLSPPVRGVMGVQLYWLFSVQRGAASTAGRSTYPLWNQRLYRHKAPETFLTDVKPLEVLRAFGLGQYHFWLEPTPWGPRSRGERLAIPQMMLWYVILLASLAGIWRLRRNPSELFILLVFLGAASAIMGMTGGNVGTIFRHRDVLTPVLIAAAGGGLAGWLRRTRDPAPAHQTGRADRGPAGKA